MGKKKKIPIYAIENFKCESPKQKRKIQHILNKYYRKRKELMSKDISREEFHNIKPWPLNNKSIEEINCLVEHEKNYGDYGKLLKIIFNSNEYQKNNSVALVALKSTFLDFINSTNVGKQKESINLLSIAQNIANLNIDEKIKLGDLDVVEQIALMDQGRNVDLWSFASKYAAFHNYYLYGNDDYVIYDSIVKENLYRYNKKNLNRKSISNLFDKNKGEKHPYRTFISLIDQILDSHKITVKNRRWKFDKFLWWQFKGFSIKSKKKLNNKKG